MEEKKNNPGYQLMLLLAAFVWGIAFVAQKTGMEHVGPFTFAGVRFFLAGLVLIPVLIIFSGRKIKAMEKEARKAYIRNSVLYGLICGVIIFVATSLQQFGILTTSAGKSGFITALYIVLVPVIAVFLGKRAGYKVWISIALAVVGMFLLCIKNGEDLSMSSGDILLILCAIAFSFHIIAVDGLSVKGDGIIISMVQFLTCSLISLIAMMIFEEPTVSGILDAKIPILYAGIMSGGVAYTFQIIGQAKVQPAVASLLMSMESVFSALAGFVILRERMTGRELVGCALMFAAVILSQLPERNRVKAEEEAETEQSI